MPQSDAALCLRQRLACSARDALIPVVPVGWPETDLGSRLAAPCTGRRSMTVKVTHIVGLALVTLVFGDFGAQNHPNRGSGDPRFR